MAVRYESLKTIVAYFSDQHEKSTGDQDKYWLLAFRGLEKLHYNITAEPKTVRLPIDSNKTVRFPPDYVTWVKIGIMNSVGEINTLRVNRALTTYSDLMPNRIANLTPDISSGWINNTSSPYVNFFNNGMYQPLFGVGNAGMVTYGDCRIDEKNNIVILSPDFAYSSILFEYISCPEKDTDYQVDVRLRESIIAFIEWKTNLGSRQNFYAEATEANRMIKPIKMQSFNQTIRLNEKMTLNN